MKNTLGLQLFVWGLAAHSLHANALLPAITTVGRDTAVSAFAPVVTEPNATSND
jgi:hypothetical protein